MPYLFDTDALSEPLKKKPTRGYVQWLAAVPRAEQYTSAVAVGELFKGAFRSTHSERHLKNIEDRLLPRLTVLPYDTAAAREYGWIRARLEEKGQLLPDADLQIAATAILHDLALVTGNVKHFERIEGLRLEPVLAEARRDRRR